MAFNLKDDPRMQQRLQGAVPATAKDIDAPPAELPPLDSIVVDVPTPPPPTEEEILARYRERLRDLAKVTPKKPGEPVAWGDEVQVSTVGHVNGALFPGSVKHGWWLEVVPDMSLAGFVEQIVGMTVGSAAVVPVVYGDKTAAMAVRILAAQTIEMPDPENPKSLGIAPTLDATLELIGRQLIDEAAEATPLRAMHAVMKKLADVAKVDIEQTAVDAEITRAWRMAEGDACIANGMTVEEQQEALKLWLASAEVRAEAVEKLKAWSALKAVAARDKLALTPQGWDRFFASFAPTLGQTPAFLKGEVDKDPKLKAELEELAFRMQVVDYVMTRVKVDVVGPISD